MTDLLQLDRAHGEAKARRYYGPDRDADRLRFLAGWLDSGRATFAQVGQLDECDGLVAGMLFRADELDYEAAGSPRGWRAR